MSEAHGLPVAFLLEAANTHESQLARDVLAEVRVPRLGKGRPKPRLLILAMDKALRLRINKEHGLTAARPRTGARTPACLQPSHSTKGCLQL